MAMYWALLALVCVPADAVETKFIPSGVTARMGGYRPIRAELDAAAEIVTKAPEGLMAPKYGMLKLNDQSWAVIVDEPEEGPAKLYVDTNGDGDLTNDPETKWDPQTRGELTMHLGTAEIDLGEDQRGTLYLYRFDPKDPSRAQLKNTLLFYTDFGFEVTLKLDDQTFTSFVAGFPESASYLSVDRDGNGQTSSKLETIRVGAPFNYTGTTYVLDVVDQKLTLSKAGEELPVAPLPPDLRLGKQALPFTMESLEGTTIDFPKNYAGKLVMLDFWATWCGPCIAELPNVKQAYADWHDHGFEVLGISFDQEGMKEKLTEFLTENEMPWQQIYEGKGWNTTLGEQYDVSGIPFVLLVDGDTGEIIGTSRELRGPGLTEFIKQQLEKKKGSAE